MISLYHNNLAKTAALIPSSENAQFPAENIKDNFRTKVWRSLTNSDNLILDLGTIETIQAFGIVDNWRDGFGITSLTLEANASTDFSSPAFTQAITLDTEFGVAVIEFATPQTFRYWRLVATSTLGFCELANVFLGTIKKFNFDFNWTHRSKDLRRETKNKYEQEFVDQFGTRTELRNLELAVMDKDELEDFLDVLDLVGATQPLFFEFCDDTQSVNNQPNRYNGQYKLINVPADTNFSAGFYSASIDLKEQK